MKVLVTGAAGFIGSHVIGHLRRRGDTAISVPRPRLDDRQSIKAIYKERQPDAVMHLAWHANPKDYLESPLNVESFKATLRLAETVFGLGCKKLVAVGTCLEYAPADSPLGETDRLEPTSLYARSKHAAQLMLGVLAQIHAAEFAWGRIFHLFGYGEKPSRMVPAVASSLAAGNETATTAGEQIRDYLHVSDVASGLIALLQPGASGPFNICSGQPVAMADILRAIANHYGAQDKLKLGSLPYSPNEIMYIVGRAGRLKSLGWQPQFSSAEAALQSYLQTR